MKITDNGKDYELNAARALELGVLKLVRKEITNIAPGDVFDAPGSLRFMLLKTYRGNFFYAGFDGLDPFSGILDGITRSEMIAKLNRDGAVLVRNINKEISSLMSGNP